MQNFRGVKLDMNAVFTVITLVSLILLLFTSPNDVFPAMMSGVENAVKLSITLLAIYAVWLSVLKIMQSIGWDKKLSAFLRPVIKRLFKGESDSAYDSIAVNLAGNMLGMGGVATPAGIDAVSKMQHDGNKASANMKLLLVINGTSIQLIPATVIALRASAGSANAASIFLPTIISSTVATVAGVIICKLFSKK